MQLCLLPSNKISRNIFVTKEHKFHRMSSDTEVYTLRYKLCEEIRDQFLSPYSQDSYLQLKQMEDRHLNTFTYVAVEHLWKHYPKSQIVLLQQRRPFTCLKCKAGVVLFKLLFSSRLQNTFSSHSSCCHCPWGMTLTWREQGNNYKGSDAR